MFSSIYFAVASALSAEPQFPAYTRKILAGQLNEACSAAAAWSDPDGVGRDSDYLPMLAYGDAQLVLGRYVEAEETYRKAQRLVRHSREALRIVSCRNAGWQAFFQNRLSTALTCFARVGSESDATCEQRMESLVGEVLVLHQLGSLTSVGARLSALAELAASAQDPRWSELATALHRDLLIQQQVRSADELHDHIYWRSAECDFVPQQNTVDTPASQLAAQMPLLAQRLAYVEQLRVFATGGRHHVETLDAHLHWAQRTGLTTYHRALCLEVAVAALAASAPNTAEAMLNQCRVVPGQQPWHERWYLEYVYCLAKVRQHQGRIQEFAQLYGRYALASIRHVRTDNQSMTPVAAESLNATRQPKSDDVSARLPGKYRRAYRYLMENLDQRDLSVRELAAHIGVTERAIQAAFKTYLGLSPSQLIRRQRMERIHDELTREDGCATSVLEVANKWGVQHRSTLVNGYRKLFHEAPSETLAR
ncbi:helix-turn-helix transcriptional regulator [Trinickia fusca]|uniref:AraC family transcriptional regulator n=1 Tax=Trinickia fusca TaxID=2419777 RepID=A0A494XAP1_9BURK|nr:helix-turn-helix transcriptional regulator [Trinickia fusca]RKP44653.1 AraC family transcriptional regulator [Trinickia fusca]